MITRIMLGQPLSILIYAGILAKERHRGVTDRLQTARSGEPEDGPSPPEHHAH
jgi:hypothetical protein